MKSYLSIDMDYWFNAHLYSGVVDVQHTYEPFMEKVRTLGVPTTFVLEHQEMLEDINNYKLNKLYNIDFHSDIVIEPVEVFDEGTWVSFYKHRSECDFEWRLPNRERCIRHGEGLCHWDYPEYDYTFPRTKFGYRSSSAITGLNGIKWDSIVAVGICLSYDWVTEEGVDLFYKEKWDMGE